MKFLKKISQEKNELLQEQNHAQTNLEIKVEVVKIFKSTKIFNKVKNVYSPQQSARQDVFKIDLGFFKVRIHNTKLLRLLLWLLFALAYLKMGGQFPIDEFIKLMAAL